MREAGFAGSIESPQHFMAGKLVLITGVTRGLGRAMTEEFARLAAVPVLGCSRTKQGIDQLRRQLGAPHDFYMVDVTLDEAVKSWASLLLNSHGPGPGD